MGWIYKITNQVNGKVYIGKTEEPNPYDRWKEHKKAYMRKNFGKRCLYNAMTKYGLDNFEFQLLKEFENGKALSDAEIEYIKQYRSYIGFEDCNGYNMTLGGDGTSYINLNDDDVINYYYLEMSVSKTARYFEVSSDSIEKILDKNNIYRLTPSEKIIYDYKNKNGGVIMFDYTNNNIVDIEDTPKIIADKYGLNAKNIDKALNRSKGYTSGKSQGYMWFKLNAFSEEYDQLFNEYMESKLSEDNLPIDEDLNYIYQ